MSNQSLQDARDRANAKFRKREEEATAGARAMAEYEAKRAAERNKIAALKALRLAKEAADRLAAAAAKPSAQRRRAAALAAKA